MGLMCSQVLLHYVWLMQQHNMVPLEESVTASRAYGYQGNEAFSCLDGLYNR